MSESSIVADTAARIFADLADPQEVNRANNGAWKELLWRAIADAGLMLVDLSRVSTRNENRAPVPGLLVVARK